MNLLENNIRPKDIMTFEAFENAITIVNAVGGSTNAVLHILAIAKEAGIKLNLKDFERIRKRTPHIANLRPAGMYVMLDLDNIGGIPVILNSLVRKGLIHGDIMTVTGYTMKKNLASMKPDLTTSQSSEKIIRRLNDPINKEGILKILKGSLAPDGGVVKITNTKTKFVGKAQSFESEETAFEAIFKRKDK